MERSISGVTHLPIGKTQENIRALQGFGKGAPFGLHREARLVGIHILRAAFVNHALRVAEDDVLPAHAQADVVLRTSDAGRARAVDDQADLADVLAHDLHGVQERRAGDNGGAVLVVVKHRDGHRLPQGLLNVEAFRSLDVFQVDSAAGGFEELAEFDDVFRVLRANFQIKDIDIGKALEEDAFAFHHRLAGQRSDVAQAQNGRAVGNHRHQVARARCIQRTGRGSSESPCKARQRRAYRPDSNPVACGTVWWASLQSCPCGPAGDNPSILTSLRRISMNWSFLSEFLTAPNCLYLAVGGPAAHWVSVDFRLTRAVCGGWPWPVSFHRHAHFQ